MDQTSKNHYILILCGGTGPRLWPLSRADHPKQFLHLFGSQSLLENTIKRALKIVSKDHIFIVSNHIYLSKIKKLTKNLIQENQIISEPLKKNTALAIIYATSVIQKINPNAIISSLPSDHYIKNITKFKTDLIKTRKLADSKHSVITIGIKPSKPDNSYGYIIPEEKNNFYYKVSQFIEKPDTELAKKLIKKRAFWNSGIYTFSIKTLEAELKQNDQNYYHQYLEFIKNSSNQKKITDIYLNSDEMAFDRVVSEKSKNLLTIPASFDWSDVGEWETIFSNLSKDKNGIALINKLTELVVHNSNNCLISGNNQKLIGLVGVNNLAIIDTKDALLICNMDQSYEVRQLVATITKNQKLKSYFLTQK